MGWLRGSPERRLVAAQLPGCCSVETTNLHFGLEGENAEGMLSITPRPGRLLLYLPLQRFLLLYEQRVLHGRQELLLGGLWLHLPHYLQDEEGTLSTILVVQRTLSSRSATFVAVLGYVNKHVTCLVCGYSRTIHSSHSTQSLQ